MKMSVDVELVVPKVPSYVRTSTKDVRFAVQDLSDQQLRELAAQWGENLVQHAAELRKTKKIK